MIARRAFIGSVVVVGALVIWTAVSRLPGTLSGYTWLPLAVLTWLSAPLALKVPGARLTFTVSESLSLMVVFGFGWEPAVVTLAIDGWLTSMRMTPRRLDRTLFNIAEPALSGAACGVVVDWLSGLPGAARLGAPLVELMLPATAGALVYILLNSALATGAMALESGASAWTTWRQHLGWLLIDHFGATSVAVLAVASSTRNHVLSIFAALPLLGALYATYRRSMRRADEALQYAERLNRLYLGTVESLATAIDAKDQVTHGHIQRVRHLALRMVGPLGVRDECVLKALEAGALLHDVGKLGVPDHILNKPGPLTPSEYEQVKRHTVIGADIVSRVEYPFPVAPIVRHHHENWDGTGYPDGLRGDAIPIGARILSVIDCYDALTSDRPYRRAMTHEAAVAIVLSRRGTMYDPAVVDAFLALPRDAMMGRTAGPGEEPVRDAHAKPRCCRVGIPALASARSEHDRTELLAALQSLAGRRDLDGALVLLGMRLTRLTPATTVALFLQPPDDLHLRLAWGSGDAVAELKTRTFPVGRGLSGWVAAHRMALLNGDGALEFGVGSAGRPVPPVALSVPVELGATLMGVLSAYSPGPPFSVADRDLLQDIAQAIAPCVTARSSNLVLPSAPGQNRSAEGQADPLAGDRERLVS